MSKDHDQRVRQRPVNEEINNELTGEELALVAGGLVAGNGRGAGNRFTITTTDDAVMLAGQTPNGVWA